MNETPVRNLLKALQRASRQVALYPPGHPLTDEAMAGALEAVEAMLGSEREALLSVRYDSFYFQRQLLPHTSLEFNGYLRMLQSRGVEAVTWLAPISAGDLEDYVRFVASLSDDLPAEGTIRLNESLLDDEGDDDGAAGKLRRSYAGSLDTMRSVTDVMARDGAFDLGKVLEAVEGLLDHCLTHSGASLLLSTIKSHDEYTFYHSVNTCILSLSLGKLVGLTPDELVPIGAGAMLHDIGKTSVSPFVLNYPGRLSREQWKEVTVHPQEGATAILAAGGAGHEVAATVALEHHSRHDGIGYPRITREGRPHPFSRLVAVSDVYDAVTTRRSYRRAETPARALEILLHGAGKSHDPDLVRAFIRMMGLYPPGSILRLRGGELVVVTDHGDELFSPQGVIARTAAGETIEPEPVSIDPEAVVAQELAEHVGIDPSSLLSAAGVAERLLPSVTSAEGVPERAGVDEGVLRDQAGTALAALASRDEKD